MKTFTKRDSIGNYLTSSRNANKTIGFVPTMGALHNGHLSLIELARKHCDLVVCSIFVNPTQFNDPNDLDKYPRTIAADTNLLEQVNCDALFYPEVSEMYDGNEQWHLNLGEAEFLLEGKSRPGHYQGVTQVVYKLFAIINPDTAFFGQKDYQQFLMISTMVDLQQLPVKLMMCPIVREADGLAMSSRNIHLTADDHKHALILSKTLNHVRENFTINNIQLLQRQAEQMINNETGVELDYFEIADGDTLRQATKNSDKIVALVAAKVGKTRLIDNVVLL